VNVEPPQPWITVEALGRNVLDGVREHDTVRGDLAILPVFRDERPLQGLAAYLDWRAAGLLSAMLRRGVCSGAAGEAVLMPAKRTLPIRRLVLLGLGNSGVFDETKAAALGMRVAEVARGLQAEDVLFALPGRVAERSVPEVVLAELVAAAAEDVPRRRFWVLADARQVSRLRRLLESRS